MALDAGAVVLRPRAVYGIGDPHLVPRLRSRVRHGILALPGPDVLLSLTAVENLASACLAALHWAPGAYNVADPEPYPRDATVTAVVAALGVPVRVVHVPRRLAGTVARVVGPPLLSRYAVDQLAHHVVLDVGRAIAAGWRPTHRIDDYLSAFARRPAS